MTDRIAASFRDPAGHLFVRDDTLYRLVTEAGRADYELLMASGLARSLQADGWLVGHDEVDPSTASGSAAYVLRPTRLPFISYPYEWSFTQLQQAARHTLAVQRAALARGATLKDASAYNIQFVGGRPVFIDTLSFTAYHDGTPWAAYRQFCQHFLAPLACMARVDIRTRDLLRQHLDGVPLDLASRLLPRRTWASPWALMHIHLHARSVERYAGASVPERSARRGVSRSGLDGILDHLDAAISALEWHPGGTQWADYDTTHGYAGETLEAKGTLISRVADAHRPTLVFDLGANTGRFSRLSVAGGGYAVALDADAGAAERLARAVATERNPAVQPLWMDLANPSAAQGWGEVEREGLADRGPADLVLALALVHHLAIGHNVPLPAIAAYLGRLGRRIVVEWVPKDDPQTQRLLRSRPDIFADYDEVAFRAALETQFVLEPPVRLPGSSRALYVGTRRGAG